MGMREIGGNSIFRGWKFWSEGEFVQGKLLDIGEDNYNKPSYRIELEEWDMGEEEGISPDDYDLVKGATFTANSTGSIDYKFQKVEIGDTVRLVYNGKGVVGKGKYKGSEFHDISVFIVDGDDSVDTDDVL